MSLGVVRNSVKPHKPGASNDFSAYVPFLALSRLAPLYSEVQSEYVIDVTPVTA